MSSVNTAGRVAVVVLIAVARAHPRTRAEVLVELDVELLGCSIAARITSR